MSASQRRKGARGELELAAELRDLFPAVARRAAGEESQDDQGRDLKGTPGFCFQCGRGKGPRPEAKLREAMAAAHTDELPIACIRRDGGDWFAVLPLGALKVLVHAYIKRHEDPAA